MTWLQDLLGWLSTDAGRSALVIGALVLVAIIVVGIISGAGTRSVARRLLVRHEQAVKTAAVATVIDSAKEASVWHSLTPQEQVLSDRAVGQAVTAIRLLPVDGARVAADWAEWRLADLKRDSATFGYQLDPAIIELRDGLIDWMRKPRKASKQFAIELERMRQQRASDPLTPLVVEQANWAAAQHQKRFSAPAPAAEPSAPAADATVPLVQQVPAGDAPAATRLVEPVGAPAASGEAAVAAPVPFPPAPARPAEEGQPLRASGL